MIDRPVADSNTISILVSVGVWLCRLCLLVLVVLLPWSFGGVDPFSQTLLFPLLFLAIIGAGFAECWSPTLRPSTLACVVPAVLLVALGCFQTWDINPSLLDWMSPVAQRLRSELRPHVPRDDSARDLSVTADFIVRAETISINPPSTRRETSLLLAGMAAYGLAIRSFASRSERLLLAAVVAMNGVAIAYFGIVQMMSWDGRLFWSVPIEGTTPFGPFINRNTGGGYLVMTLAACIYLTANAWCDEGTKQKNEQYRGRRNLWQAWLPPRHVCLWTLLAMSVVITAGIVLSLSRGAWLGTATGSLAVFLVARPKQLKSAHLLLIMGLLAMVTALLTWLSLTDVVRQRIPESADHLGQLDGRLDLWADILWIVPDFWRMGSGLGTFGLIQPIYQQRPMLIWSDQAENLFLQALVEGGLPGLLLLMALALWPVRILLNANAGDASAELRNLIGLGIFLVISQVTCASFDFGLRYPANQLNLAVLLGCTIGAIIASRCDRVPQLSSRYRRGVIGGIYLSVAIALGLAWREIAWSGGIELALNRGDPLTSLNTLTDKELDDLEAALTVLLSVQPDHAEGYLRQADLEVQRYRRAALKQLHEELGDQIGMSDDELWGYTSLATLRREAISAANAGDSAILNEIREQPLIHEHLTSARNYAERAQAVGPFLFRAHQLLAELSFLSGDPRENAADVRRAVQLVPQQPDVRYWAGDIDIQAGRTDSGERHWRACLEQTSKYDDEICSTAIVEIPVSQFVNHLLPENVIVLARLLESGQLNTIAQEVPDLLASRLLQASATALDNRPEKPYVAAWSWILSGQPKECVQSLQQSLALAPDRTSWRLLLSEQLWNQGRRAEAVREVEVALRLNPASSEARRKLEEYLQATKP